MTRRLALTAGPWALALAVLVSLIPGVAHAPGTPYRQTSYSSSGGAHLAGRLPLAGIRIALDPGHQLGNHNFPAEINRIVKAGRDYRKACNTTGTAIDGGLPEATIVWRIARQARARLEQLGAKVFLTRGSNSERRWGPCVDTRGRFGKRVDARLMVSIHADGEVNRSFHGFHVIPPSRGHLVKPSNVRPSMRLAKAVRRGFDRHHIARSNYIGGGTALNPRNDLGTLNMARVPVAMVEIGNVHNRSDAHQMSTVRGRHRYAMAVVAGIRAFLGR
ncbi:N-acetylmuramoyl-L-alanine amidase [Nocardioides terrisoli]|uniref:N-acetylmuramoyl-L-alanine amidase n=1 Tax=Nocardioides terrisoli TaxID=3388267 RepID=UPI00287BA8A8|nr:N-acetylmuramoyl-L-alanine amidase [Nocardioides marmorisolisilvae]